MLKNTGSLSNTLALLFLLNLSSSYLLKIRQAVLVTRAVGGTVGKFQWGQCSSRSRRRTYVRVLVLRSSLSVEPLGGEDRRGLKSKFVSRFLNFLILLFFLWTLRLKCNSVRESRLRFWSSVTRKMADQPPATGRSTRGRARGRAGRIAEARTAEQVNGTSFL